MNIRIYNRQGIRQSALSVFTITTLFGTNKKTALAAA